MMPKANIGTRGSDLALYQANLLKGKLELKGLDGQIVTISTTGDRNQDRNLQSLGTGIFTKALDEALSNGDIDLAVHSMKDVPTILQEDIEVFAVLERGECGDVLVVNNLERNVVATGSIRRRAQWLRRYPQDEVHGLRRDAFIAAKVLQVRGEIRLDLGRDRDRPATKPNAAEMVPAVHLVRP